MGSNPEEALLQEPDDYLVPNPFAAVILQDQLPKHYFTEFTPGHTVPKDKTESSSSHTSNDGAEPWYCTKFANASKLEYRIQFINTKFANASELEYLIQFSNTKFAKTSELEYWIQLINTKFANASELEYWIQLINTKFANASKLEYLIQFINTKFANASELEYLYRIHYDESVVFERFCMQYAKKQMYYYGTAVYRNLSEASGVTGCYSNRTYEYGADSYRTQLDAYVGYKHPGKPLADGSVYYSTACYRT
uniref:RGS domain-containing protein n=1 Tax=Globodera pallida TaxID=36090 RepID=A0A183BJ53_GLOPA